MQTRHFASVITFVVLASIVIGLLVLWVHNTDHAVLPKVSLNIVFSHHQLTTDISPELLKDKIKNADIFLMEYPAWSPKWEKDLNRVSQGKLTPDDFLANWSISKENADTTFQFLKLEVNAVYQSGVFVTSVDLQSESSLSKDIQKYLPVMDQVSVSSDFQQTLGFERAKYAYFMGLQVERQQYMVTAYADLVQKIEAGNMPKVKGKQDVKIFFLLGSNHLRVYDLLKKEGGTVTKEFAHTPYTYDYPGELTLTFIAGDTVSDELIASGLLQAELVGLYGPSWVHDQEKLALLVRSIVTKFTFDEIKTIFTAMAHSQDSQVTFRQLFTEIAKQKHIEVPVTKQEFDSFTIKN